MRPARAAKCVGADGFYCSFGDIFYLKEDKKRKKNLPLVRRAEHAAPLQKP
jgi:hypothetical protein